MKKTLFLSITFLAIACSPQPEKVNLVTGSKQYPAVISPTNACPNWTKRNGGSNFYNTPHSNFNCATTTNIGVMVADPNDMIIGKKSSSVSGAKAVTAISNYEAGGGAAASSGAASGGSVE